MQHKAIAATQQLITALKELCKHVLLQTEPHCSWEDLPGQRSLHSVSRIHIQIVTETDTEALPKCWHVRELEHAVKK